MPDFNVSSTMWTFIQSADVASMRTNMGIALTQSGSAALAQSGNFTISLVGTATVTLTLPGVTGTLATLAGTETFTNKTLTSAALNTCTIGSAGVTFTGSSSGSTVLRAAATASGTVIIPAGNDTLVTLTAAQTLQSKTFIAPILGSATATTINGVTISGSGTADIHVAGSWDLGSGGVGGVTLLSSGAATLTLPAGTASIYSTATGSITSAQLRASITDETGTGVAVFNTSPVLITPTLGVASATSLTLSGDLSAAGITLSGNLECLAIDCTSIACSGVVTGNITPNATVYSADGAITVASGTAMITKSSAAALSIAAPSSQDGYKITIVSTTDFAHVVSFTGGTLRDGTTGTHTTATFAAFAGASLTVIARGSQWFTESVNAVTIT